MCDTQEEMDVTHTKKFCVSLLLDYGVTYDVLCVLRTTHCVVCHSYV